MSHTIIGLQSSSNLMKNLKLIKNQKLPQLNLLVHLYMDSLKSECPQCMSKVKNRIQMLQKQYSRTENQITKVGFIFQLFKILNPDI